MLRTIVWIGLLSLMTGCATVTPTSTGMLCPYSPWESSRPPPPPPATPPLVGYRTPDRDFGGHGPSIEIDVEVCISMDGVNCVATGGTGTRIIALIDFDAWESNADGTRAGDGTRIWQRFVHPIYPASRLAPATAPILSIDSPTTSTITTRSAAAGFETEGGCHDGAPINPRNINIDGGLVRSVSLIGDTGHNDVSHDPDCRCDTRINDIVFNRVDFTLDDGPPTAPEVTVEWRTGPWSACMDNTRTREVTCIDSSTGTVVDDALCAESAGPRPQLTESCGGTITDPCGSSPTASSCTTVVPARGRDLGIVSTCLYNGDPPVIVECRPSWCEPGVVRWCPCTTNDGFNWTFGDPPVTHPCSRNGCGPATGPLIIVGTPIEGNACFR